MAAGRMMPEFGARLSLDRTRSWLHEYHNHVRVLPRLSCELFDLHAREAISRRHLAGECRASRILGCDALAGEPIERIQVRRHRGGPVAANRLDVRSEPSHRLVEHLRSTRSPRPPLDGEIQYALGVDMGDDASSTVLTVEVGMASTGPSA